MTNRYEMLKTSHGFMVYDQERDDFLQDRHGNNTFDSDLKAERLIEKAAIDDAELFLSWFEG